MEETIRMPANQRCPQSKSGSPIFQCLWEFHPKNPGHRTRATTQQCSVGWWRVSHLSGQCSVLASIYKKGGMKGVIIHETCTLRKAKYELSKAAFGYSCFMYTKMDLSLMSNAAWGLWNTLISTHQNCSCTPPASSARKGEARRINCLCCIFWSPD